MSADVKLDIADLGAWAQRRIDDINAFIESERPEEVPADFVEDLAHFEALKSLAARVHTNRAHPEIKDIQVPVNLHP